MKPYKLIKGSVDDIKAFEDQVSKALEDGYELSNDLIVKSTTNNKSGEQETIFLQPVIYEEVLEFEDAESLDYESCSDTADQV